VIDPVIRESARQKVINFLDSVRQDIMAGRTSMTLQAARHSEDPGSRYKGGCYPLQSRGMFVPPYEAAVFNTPEGDYSPVFETEYGYHFVKVIEKRGDYYEACHILMSPKVSVEDFNSAKLRADSIHRELMKGSLKFMDAALRFSTDKDTRNQEGKVSNPQSGFRFDVAQLPAELNLTLRGLDTGAVSEPILNTKGDGSQSYIIYRLDQRLPAHRANLEQDYEIFQSQAEAREKQQETDKWVRSKLAWTFVSFSDEYKDCEMSFDWLKKSK
jgi:peptidyl-prolyl cis-trans isomerase SurA